MLGFLQRIGRSLLLPIAILPIAALLLRLGAPDLLNIPFMSAAGAAVFDNLALLFAVGIATGMADDHRGEAALAAVAGFLVLVTTTQALLSGEPPLGAGYAPEAQIVTRLSNNVLLGVLAGLVAVWTYNRFRGVQLPGLLGFFSGRRLVPILTSLFVLIFALILRFVWPPIWEGLNSFNNTILAMGALGTGLFGLLNRALMPLGLHHVPDTFFWFELGEFTTANGAVVRGDIPRFLSGDPTAGPYQVGFYPIMMFGLAGAALAMIVLARKGRRLATTGLLGGAALVSFVTGITEPLEYAFMFVAPFLFAVHAVFAALSGYITNIMGLRHGFGFSAGLIDYLLYFDLAERPLELAAVGGGFFALYFVVFYGLIRAFDLQTPGREKATALSADEPGGVLEGDAARDEERLAQARGLVYALGGAENIVAVDNCATRLRLTVQDAGRVNEKTLKALGAKGVVKPSSKAVQVIMGADADLVADAMTQVLAAPAPTSSLDEEWQLPQERPAAAPVVVAAAAVEAAQDEEAAEDEEAAAVETTVEPAGKTEAAPAKRAGPAADADDPAMAASVSLLIDALGGASNIVDAGVVATTRLRVVVADSARVNEDALRAAGASGVMLMDDTIHILLGMRAGRYGAEMMAQLLET